MSEQSQQQPSDSISLLEPPPVTVLLLRNPVPPSEGTDPYHDSFGPFCLPSFPLSALESGASTPLPAVALPLPHLDLIESQTLDNVAEHEVDAVGRNGNANPASALPALVRKRGKWITDEHILTTHHCSRAPDQKDPEVEIEREFCVTSVPIIAHRCVNVREIAKRLLWGSPAVLDATPEVIESALDEEEQRGERVPYDGVVVTSQRTVETLTQSIAMAVEMLKDGSTPLNKWSSTPFFAVGPATSSALRSLGKSSHASFAPKLVMGGSATGTGETLANYIIRHFGCSHDTPTPSVLSQNSSPPPARPPRRLLVLQGDKALPLLPELLRRAHPPLELELVRAYETCADERFSDSCYRVARTLALARQSRSRRPSLNVEGAGGDGSSQAHKTMRGLVGALTPLDAVVESPTSTDAEASSSVVLDDGDPSSTSTASTTSLAQTSTKSSRASSFGSVTSFSSVSVPTHPPRPDWIVFFSPSGVQFALPELQARGWFPPSASSSSSSMSASPSPPPPPTQNNAPEPAPPHFPRIAVLGPTTKRYLRDAHNLAPDAVAAIPGPPELREALKGAMKRIGREEKKREAERRAQDGGGE